MDEASILGHEGPVGIGNFESRAMHCFLHHFTDIVRPSYILWLALAMPAAYRVSGGHNVVGRKRVSDH
ncbi:MAG TPA: hypothetical protein VLJ44_01575 [Gaiellaceae bacterium]|nr:hypothetical protein [Gaiellaceae bacterium]